MDNAEQEATKDAVEQRIKKLEHRVRKLEELLEFHKDRLDDIKPLGKFGNITNSSDGPIA